MRLLTTYLLTALTAASFSIPAHAQAPDADPLACAALYRHYTPIIMSRVPETDNLLRYDYGMRAVAAEAIGKANGQTAPKSDAAPGESEFQDWQALYSCDEQLGFTPITAANAKAEPDNLMCGASLVLSALALGETQPGTTERKQYDVTQEIVYSVYAPLARAGVPEAAQEAALIANLELFGTRHADEGAVNPHNILTGERASYHFTRHCIDNFPRQAEAEPIFTWDRPNEQVCGAIETFMAEAEANPYEPNIEPPEILKAEPFSTLRCNRIGYDSTRFSCQADLFFDPTDPDSPPSLSKQRKEMLSGHSNFGTCSALEGWNVAEFGNDPSEYDPSKVGRVWTSPDGKRSLEWMATRDYISTGRRKRNERVTGALAVEIQRD